MFKPNWRTALKFPIVAQADPNWDINILESRLSDATQSCGDYCLKGNSTIHFCLSGDVDSSLSLAMPRRRLPNAHILAYTIGDGPGQPDVESAAKIAALHDAGHLVFTPSQSDIEMAGVVAEQIFGDAVSDGIKAICLLYMTMSRMHAKIAITYDGMDELMGGYRIHREHDDRPDRKRTIFENCWKDLRRARLDPLHTVAKYFGIEVIHPYLEPGVVVTVSHIPLDARTDRDTSKKPLREIGRRYGLPDEILSPSQA